MFDILNFFLNMCILQTRIFLRFEHITKTPVKFKREASVHPKFEGIISLACDFVLVASVIPLGMASYVRIFVSLGRCELQHSEYVLSSVINNWQYHNTSRCNALLQSSLELIRTCTTALAVSTVMYLLIGSKLLS